MKPLKLYINSINRYKRSKGFGIHSPFAFHFVTRVLRERLPFYAYPEIGLRRNMALNLAEKIARHPKVISLKNAKMLFRITNYFNPAEILQIGTSYGVSTTAILDVSSTSRLYIYPGQASHPSVYEKVTHRYGNRIVQCGTLSNAIDSYNKAAEGSAPFILINSIDDENDFKIVAHALRDMLNRDGVAILRNLTKSDKIAALLKETDEELTHGMTFSNGNLAIIVGQKHLPRQTFSLWY